MSEIIKNQHYVWRRYLKPWSIEGKGKQIYTYFMDNDEIGKTSLMNVAQERFFYEIQDLSDIELIAARNYVNTFPSFTRPYANTFLLSYEVVSKGMMSDSDRLEFAKNSFEKTLSSIERDGTNLLNCKSLKELKDIPNLDQCVFYLCIQYCRTKKMRMNGINGFHDRPLASQLFDKLFPLTTILFGTTLAHNIFVGNLNTKYVFIKNETDSPFLTSDQPAINLLSDDLDENGYAKSFELYYPTSPSTAIMITFRPEIEKFSEIIADEAFVEYVNKKICENALSFIFADKIDNLHFLRLNKT
jgi:hypothetical protein